MKKLENIINSITVDDIVLCNYLKYVYNLEYENTPNYNALEKLFYL